MPDCVFDCRHPVWRSKGNCSTEQASPHGADYNVCSCDPGFASNDSLGNASCVSERALTGIFALVGTMACLALGVVIRKAWKARGDRRRLVEPSNLNRRTRLVARLVATTSLFCGSSWITNFVAAARVVSTSSPFSSWMLQLLYATSIPMISNAASIIMGLWLDSLPKQLLPSGSVMRKAQLFAEKHNVFERAGLACMFFFISLGAMTFFYFDTLKVVRTINLATAFFATVALVCFNVVGIVLTGIINRAKRKTTGTAIYFCSKALKVLWAQVLALSLAAGLWITAALALELTEGGRGTPAIPISVMVVDASYGFCLAIQFAKVERRPPSFSSSRESEHHLNAKARRRKEALNSDNEEGHELEEGGGYPSAFGGGGDVLEPTTKRSEEAQKTDPPRSMRPGTLAVQGAMVLTKPRQGGVSSSNPQNVQRRQTNGKGGGAAARENGGLALASSRNTVSRGSGTSKETSTDDSCAGEMYNSPWSLSDLIEKATDAYQDNPGTPPTGGLIGEMIMLPRSNAEPVEPSRGIVAAGARVVPSLGFEEDTFTAPSIAQLEHGSHDALERPLPREPRCGSLPPVLESPPRSRNRELPPIVRKY